jgi:acetyltransferase-like isoleucine patch superfamily enzyme
MSGLDLHISTMIGGTVVVEPPFRVFQGSALNEVRGGGFTYMAPQCALHRTILGRYNSIGNHVRVLSDHPTDRLTTSPFAYEVVFPKPFDAEPISKFSSLRGITRTGNDVWIGAGTQLRSGITIGDGAIIGAGSVLTKDVEPYTIVGGVPARVIRKRFTDTVQERVEKLQWWRFNLVGVALPWEDLPRLLDILEEKIAANELPLYKPQRFIVERKEKALIATPWDEK